MRKVVNLGWAVLTIGCAALIIALSGVRGAATSPGGRYFYLALPTYGLLWAMLVVFIYRVWCSGWVGVGQRMKLTVVTALAALVAVGLWSYQRMGLAMLNEILANVGGLVLGFGLIGWWHWWQRTLQAEGLE